MLPSSHWHAIHQYAVEHADNWNSAAARKHYAQWAAGIPSIGCSCMKHWEEYTAANPPQFDSAREHFIYFWRAHNHVSERYAGKPTITLEEAIEMYTAGKVKSLVPI